MNTFYTNSKTNRYRAIYVEEKALDYPVAQSILSDHSSAHIIYIRHYKDILNRPRQSRAQQDEYPALILAVKDFPYIYPGPEVCQKFDHQSFYYSNLLLNCPFDCEYCYLCGMYPSAYCVAFVNTNDFINAIQSTSQAHDDMMLALSYDTDLLAFENTYPYTQKLISELSSQSNLHIEIRTKSAVTSVYEKTAPSDNIVFAFSLSPDSVAKQFEKKTPSLKSRIHAVNSAIKAGHKVRLCFDPIFTQEKFQEAYHSFFLSLPQDIPMEYVREMSYGFFRMSHSYFKKIAAMRTHSEIFSDNYIAINDVVSKPQEECDKIAHTHMQIIQNYFPKERIFRI